MSVPDAAAPDAPDAPDATPPPTSVAGSAWAPGLRSDIPTELRPLITLFRPEHAFVDHAEASELAGFSGLDVLDLVALRPERLVVHELLVRVTADLSVPDGPGYETLGLNLRAMVGTIHERHVAPEMARIAAAWEAERAAARELVADELAARLFGSRPGPATDGASGESGATPRRGSLGRLLGGSFGGMFGGLGRARTRAGAGGADRESGASDGPRELRALAHWRRELDAGVEDPLRAACLRALVDVVDAITAHRGRVPADPELVGRLAVNRVGGDHGARLIGRLLGPAFDRAVEAEGYRRLPVRAEPVVMNVKGASASGKSTIRPEQREFAGRLGVAWEDFALISPDYWRKYLLDYATLGEHHKYGAMLTGSELELVDAKLDRYMADKATAGRMSHLLIDRFRFDSFALADGRTADSRLLSRFGHRVFMFFMITPPAATVERAWARGLSTGRYKAVDDLLFHNVEAFTGMPALFLSWVGATDREVHFEFLDNGVSKDETPRTVAFGGNGSMTILDVGKLLDVDRYRKVNVDAGRPEDVLDEAGQAAPANLGFVRRCAEGVGQLMLADGPSGSVYARVEAGRPTWWDEGYLAALPASDDRRLVLEALGCAPGRCPPGAGRPLLDVASERRLTLGRWPGT